jgi:hypothetical protein|tara:strand:- start:36 stop:461 length:426 start_codon:yes stop_codon:yes gene_type:complete
MKVYVYVVLFKDHVKCVATTIEQARQGLLDQGFSGEEYLKSAEKMQAEFEEDDFNFLYMEGGPSWSRTSNSFLMFRMPLIGELPKPTSKVTIDITPKQLKQEQDELKSFDLPIFYPRPEPEEDDSIINNQIDQIKEDELGW